VIQGQGGNTAAGCFIGVDQAGTAAAPVGGEGILVQSSNDNTIGGTAAADRNVISGNGFENIELNGHGVAASRNVVQGNFLGTNAAGTAKFSNGGNGVFVNDADTSTIGGTATGAGNLISGDINGIEMGGANGNGNVIEGNLIGTDVTGTKNIGNANEGIGIGTGGGAGGDNDVIGGAVPGAANTIAFNLAQGLIITASNHDLISENSFFSNGTGGIVLSGGNNNAVAPHLTGLSNSASGLDIQGNYHGLANATLRIEFFASPTFQLNEGKTFLGAKDSVTTDASGNATFDFLVPPNVASNLVGQFFTATATDQNNDTSQFSTESLQFEAATADLAVKAAASPNPINVGDQVTFTFTITNSGPSSASGVNFTDVLPSGATFASASSTQGSATEANGTVSVPIGNINPNSSVVVTVKMTATAAGTLSDPGLVTESTVDPTPNDNSESASVTVNQPVSNVLTKSIDLVFGTETTLAGSGFPSQDLVALSALLPSDALNALINQAIDPRVAAGATALRDASAANPNDLSFFTATTSQTEVDFGGSIQKPSSVSDIHSGALTLYQSYVQTVTGGAGRLNTAGEVNQGQLTFTFPLPPNTQNSSSGKLTVNVFKLDGQIAGPISTGVSVQASPQTVSAGQPVTVSAIVTGNGQALPAAGESIEFFDGTHQIGTAEVDANGHAQFQTTSLSVGQHEITAFFPGDGLFAAHLAQPVSVVVNAQVVNQDGPRVLSLQRFGIHRQPTILVLTFNELLDPARAQNPANYQILTVVQCGRSRYRTGRAIRISSVLYNPATKSVTIFPAERLDLHKLYQLTVNGLAPNGLTDTSGNLLDGSASGTPGSNFVAIIDRNTLAGRK
jgi:uncharacterized repeat protein (TIGR01451 family)